MLPADDLLRDAVYRRLWSSILISSLGGQVTLLALPLTAVVLLQATPMQMGLLTAMEIVPFALFSLPVGVWLDRVRKLPVYVGGELLLATAVASVPLAWWMGWLAMPWMYGVAFVIGTVFTVAGSAAQIVLVHVVARERLVEAHAKNALASSGAEVAGPGIAGVLIRLLGAPVALIVDAVALLASAAILAGVRLDERHQPRSGAHFGADLKAGLRFVGGHRLLVVLAVVVGVWQWCQYASMAVLILFATRVLGLDEQGVGLSYAALGAGTVATSFWSPRISRRFGPGPCLLLGAAVCSAAWLLLAMLPATRAGVAGFAALLALLGAGATLVFVNFLALRQAVTPSPLLGRMTSTMRWLILLPAGPGALLGGWLGEHAGLRAPLLLAGATSALLVCLAGWHPVLRRVRQLPV